MNDTLVWSRCDAPTVISEACKGNGDAVNEALERLALVTGCGKQRRTVFVLVTNDGHWARGEEIAVAANRLRKLASSKSLVRGWVVLNDPEPSVDSAGYLVSDAAAVSLGLGQLGKLSGII